MQGRTVKKALMGVFFLVSCITLFLPEIAFTKQNKTSTDVVFTCDEFPQKIQNCEAYTCYVTMGSVMTVTEIIEERGSLCAVSSTVGVSLAAPKTKPGEDLKPSATIPVTTICEYDRNGINQLSNKFQAMKSGRFNFSSEEMELGEHNCQTYALGQIFPTPRVYTMKREAWQ